MSERLLREQEVIDLIENCGLFDSGYDIINLQTQVRELPSVEPLTDIEQRIFLAAFGKEEKVCRKVDKEVDGDINLTHVCKEIERKVKGALWN